MARAAEVALTGSDQLITANDLTRLLGWSVRESGGTNPVAIDLYDAESATGNRVGTIRLAANESETVWLGEDGITVNTGIYADLTGTGTLVGCIYIA